MGSYMALASHVSGFSPRCSDSLSSVFFLLPEGLYVIDMLFVDNHACSWFSARDVHYLTSPDILMD
jgi:hypothetical protein